MAEWFEYANCRGVNDNSIFFPDADRMRQGSHVWDDALKFCTSCPVRRECLDFQMPFEEASGRRDGMWGGLTPKQRDMLAYERQRLRP